MSASNKVATPEHLTTMVELLPTVASLRDLAAIVGLRFETVRRETAPFIAAMRLNGTLPNCACGRERFHARGCTESFKRRADGNAFAGKPAHDWERLAARRAAAVEMIAAGMRYVDISAALGMRSKGARKYLRFLTPEQLAQRERALAERRPPTIQGARP